MTTSAYVFEKAGYAVIGLCDVAEDLHLLPADTPAHGQVRAHLRVAARHTLLSCSVITGIPFDPAWIKGLLQGARGYWDETLKPILEEALFGPVEEDPLHVPGMPREHSDERERPLGEDVTPRACKALAALVDLADAIRIHRYHELEGARFRAQLALALDGAVKVVATLLAADYKYEWAKTLAEGGRTAFRPVLESLRESSTGDDFEWLDFDPLDEVWLVHADPFLTPDVEIEEEHQRRRQLTLKSRLSGDLVIPERYRELDLSRLAESHIPAHRECAKFAENPDGVLSLNGEFKSGLGGVLWCIARYWFVDRLQNVRAFDWSSLVHDNVMAQDRANWTIPHGLPTEPGNRSPQSFYSLSKTGLLAPEFLQPRFITRKFSFEFVGPLHVVDVAAGRGDVGVAELLLEHVEWDAGRCEIRRVRMPEAVRVDALLDARLGDAPTEHLPHARLLHGVPDAALADLAEERRRAVQSQHRAPAVRPLAHDRGSDSGRIPR